MSDDLHLLDLETGKWHNVVLKAEQLNNTPQQPEKYDVDVEESKESVTGEFNFTLQVTFLVLFEDKMQKYMPGKFTKN